MYVLVCGYPPFDAPDIDELFDKTRKGVFAFDPEDWEDMSDDCKDFISKMLVQPLTLNP